MDKAMPDKAIDVLDVELQWIWLLRNQKTLNC
jgi:hypothetical protein